MQKFLIMCSTLLSYFVNIIVYYHPHSLCVSSVFTMFSSKLKQQTLKALSDDTIFACDCSRLHQTRFESCRVRGTIVSCETNLRQSGGIGANRVKKSRRVRGVSHDTIFSPDSITQKSMSRSFQIRSTALLILTFIFRRCKMTEFLSTCHTFIIFHCH